MGVLGKFLSKSCWAAVFLEQRDSHDNCVAGGNWIAECCNKILFVRAQELSPRQKAQQGSFILFSNDIAKDKKESYYFQKTISPIPKNHASIIQRFIIPGDHKTGLLKQLSMIGISKSILFPDNVDYVCEEITNSQKLQLTIPKTMV